MLNIFIGYDSREDDAYEVAKASILSRAGGPIHIQRLTLSALKKAGLYRRTWTEQGGFKIDDVDGKPFSTDFSFSRFLVPALCQWEGWAVFMDCDMLALADFCNLEKEFDDKYAVMCCKQDYRPKVEFKMDGQKQDRYFRKNWSSFMAFNCGHPANQGLTVDAMNMEPGSWLHGLKWLRDEEIGDLNHGWNWIDGTTEGEPLNVHYTLGGPWFEHMRYSNAPYFQQWRDAAASIGRWNELGRFA